MTFKPIDDIDTNALTDEDYIKLAYLGLLQRKVDEVGFNYWMSKIADGTFKYKDLLDAIIASPEYIMHYRKPFHQVLHEGRQAWMRTLPKFDTIFDIGGSSALTDTGTLIEFGYPHRPRELIIFDLPPDEQYWGKPRFPQDRDYTFDWGSLRYFHGHIEDIYTYSELNGKTFDCVFMGQVIEHIEKDRLDLVLKWIREHLNRNGRFIFDTPNRDLTRIQFPDRWMDKDHKYEYTPYELELILRRAGFSVVKKTGIVAMPESYKTRNFNPLEVYETDELSTNPEMSYLFAFECVKA